MDSLFEGVGKFIDLEVYAFLEASGVDSIPNTLSFQQPGAKEHFHFVPYQIPSSIAKPEWLIQDQKVGSNNFRSLEEERKVKVRYQNEAIIMVLKEWKRKFADPDGNDVFLYMEDDFVLCPNAAALHLISLYYWALRRRRLWRAVRISHGFNGLFLQSRDIDEFIQVIHYDLYYPFDYQIGNWWSSLIHDHNAKNDDRKTRASKDDNDDKAQNRERVLYTFRYTLFSHIGHVSAMGNENDHGNIPQCFDGMNQYILFIFTQSYFLVIIRSSSNNFFPSIFNFYAEKFDTTRCSHFMISPCSRGIVEQNELKLVTREMIETKTILTGPHNKFLRKKMKAYIIFRASGSCNSICKNQNIVKGVTMTCHEELYPFVNDCDELDYMFNCKNPCFLDQWNVYYGSYPYLQLPKEPEIAMTYHLQKYLNDIDSVSDDDDDEKQQKLIDNHRRKLLLSPVTCHIHDTARSKCDREWDLKNTLKVCPCLISR